MMEGRVEACALREGFKCLMSVSPPALCYLFSFSLDAHSHSKCSSRAPASLLLTHRKPLPPGCTATGCWKCSILEEKLMVVLEGCTNSAPLQLAQQGGKVMPWLWHTRCGIPRDQRLQGICLKGYICKLGSRVRCHRRVLSTQSPSGLEFFPNDNPGES